MNRILPVVGGLRTSGIGRRLGQRDGGLAARELDAPVVQDNLYRGILSELKSRGVIPDGDTPVGDYAEYLVATALGGQLAPNAEKSWDVLGSDGEKLQVKARVVSDPAGPGQLQLSPFRSFGFDSAVIVLLSATDYAVAIPTHQT